MTRAFAAWGVCVGLAAGTWWLGVAAGAAQRSGTPPQRPVVVPRLPIARFSGLERLFREMDRQTKAERTESTAARLFDFELLLAAVAGEPVQQGRSVSDYREAFAGRTVIDVPASAAVHARDDTAYRLHSLGYSAKEIADILAGRITKAALDTAQRMLMAGYGRPQVSDFVDREYARLAAGRAARAAPAAPAPTRRTPPAAPRAGTRRAEPTPIPAPVRRAAGEPASAADAFVEKHASRHGVDPALVRAVIACESGWDATARSPVGAVGLMQLMPGTARQLGIDPHDIEQNIEGGVRLLASFLRQFKTLELTLVAYNAGPAFAERYARGDVALYGETRAFVRNVLAQMGR